MGIYMKTKIIFIHIAKNCGNSIKRVLVSSENKDIELCDLGKLFHVQTSLKKYEKNRKNLEEYFKFTIIRNPWERIVSFYNYHIKSQQKHWDFIDYLEKKYKIKSEKLSNSIIEKELKNFEYLKYSDDYIFELKKRGMFKSRINQIKKGKKFYENEKKQNSRFSFKE